MKMKIFLILTTALLLIACEKVGVYSKFDDNFESNRWVQSDAKLHEFNIADDSKVYDLVLCFSHVYDYQFASVPMAAEITDPSGKSEKVNFDLLIKDSSGKQLADCSGDVCDLEYKIKENVKLEKGTYKVTLSHSFQGPYLPNVLGVGLAVRDSK